MAYAMDLVVFLAVEHRHPLPGNNLHCLAQWHAKRIQSYYVATPQNTVKAMTSLDTGSMHNPLCNQCNQATHS